MELGLSLGHHDSRKPFKFLEKSQKIIGEELGFCMAVGKVNSDADQIQETGFSSSDPPVQLGLLPFSPVHKNQPSSNKFPFHWLNEKLGGDSGKEMEKSRRGDHEAEEVGSVISSSPNCTVSSFQMDFSIFRSSSGSGNRKRDFDINEEGEADRCTSSRGSDDDENGTRKKLRLTKEQSAFLEDSFKEQNTLNPKQKLALAKQLSLRPRQVEVWFQNRRARTKLKQTEVDCEYLKRCCETLTEENRRLQKEVHELRTLKAASQPFYMQLPATTLTMCPSCERVATTTAAGNSATASVKKPTEVLSLSPSQQPV